MTVFGTIVTPTMVEGAFRETFQRWSPTYLRQMERETGRKHRSLPDVRTWRFVSVAGERFPEEQIPAVQIIIPEVELTTESDSVKAAVSGTVDVLVQSTEPEPARELAYIYAFHLGLILLHQDATNETVRIGSPVGWTKLGTPAVGKPKSRWLALGSSAFSCVVNGIATPRVGPVVPDEELPPEYPVGETHRIDLTPEA
jgi:hypothetical protein